MLKNCVNIFMKTKFLLSLSVYFYLKLCESPEEPPFKNWPLGLDRVKTNGKTKVAERGKGILSHF